MSNNETFSGDTSTTTKVVALAAAPLVGFAALYAAIKIQQWRFIWKMNHWDK